MDGNAKQLLSERIKNATNILVTVSRDPSVDELSAALGLTLMLNKMDKHATAVFSGTLPPAIEFLQPEKTFEGTVDSLRDFIIALDKEKADRLRYKVEDDVVRIFITPYRTIISEKDLQFSQGDFNVELIVALGVEKREDLDNAITAHGRILHDATVVTVNASAQKSELGSIDWTDSSASSLCEMLMSLSESLQSGLLDQQISTALLTGIVAATERFSNNSTSPKVMTMAAQLMAAGANQQLIATKLEQGHELIQPAGPTISDGTKKLNEGESQKLAKDSVLPPVDPNAPVGEMHVDHSASEQAEQKATTLADAAEQQTAAPKTEEKLSEALSAAMPATPTLSVDDLKKDLAAASDAVNEAATSALPDSKASDWRDRDVQNEPSFGGTLNATTDEAAAEKRREEESHRNHTLLSHDSPSAANAMPLNGAMAGNDEPPTVDPFAEPPKSEPDAPMHYEPTPIVTVAPPTPGSASEPAMPPPLPPMPPAPEPSAPVKSAPTIAELEAQAKGTAAPLSEVTDHVGDARAAVDAALNGMPFDPAHQPLESVGAREFDAPAPQTPSAPPLPDFSTLPPLPGEPVVPPAPNNVATPPAAPPLSPTANDPGQFKLPGQQ